MNKLIRAVATQKRKPGSRLYQCGLGLEYIASDSGIVSSPAFEAGVVKIQSGNENEPNRQEKLAVSCLLRHQSTVCIDDNTAKIDDTTMPMEQQLRKKRKVEEGSTYIDCRFILGSVSEIERMWSRAKYVLSDQRSRLTPELFEAILFLKLNSRFWNPLLVSKAYKNFKNNTQD